MIETKVKWVVRKGNFAPLSFSVFFFGEVLTLFIILGHVDVLENDNGDDVHIDAC